MTNKEPAKTELTKLALELLKGSSLRKDLLNSEEEVQQLWDSLDSRIRPKALANMEMRRKSWEMASRHFVS
ncbi:MAG: hypothetical protein [Olavius algarvensis Gamma 1 endosymbiont]|nr:MAG: hypothetical protein [Olavius algarvensis Gamma 1 endosymbiont]